MNIEEELVILMVKTDRYVETRGSNPEIKEIQKGLQKVVSAVVDNGGNVNVRKKKK